MEGFEGRKEKGRNDYIMILKNIFKKGATESWRLNITVIKDRTKAKMLTTQNVLFGF